MLAVNGTMHGLYIGDHSHHTRDERQRSNSEMVDGIDTRDVDSAIGRVTNRTSVFRFGESTAPVCEPAKSNKHELIEIDMLIGLNIGNAFHSMSSGFACPCMERLCTILNALPRWSFIAHERYPCGLHYASCIRRGS